MTLISSLSGERGGSVDIPLPSGSDKYTGHLLAPDVLDDWMVPVVLKV